MKNILEETPPGHDDHDTIPTVLDMIKELGKETEPGVGIAKQKVELWKYNTHLVFKIGEDIVRFRLPSQIDALNANLRQDTDLLNENRSLIHTGKLLQRPEAGFEWSGWTELFAFLFDNYCRGLDIGCFLSLTHDPPIVVMTKPKEKDGVTKYQVYRRVSRVQFSIVPQIITSAVSPSLWTFSL